MLVAVIACTTTDGGQDPPLSPRLTSTVDPRTPAPGLVDAVPTSLALVATSVATGSGILIEGGLVVTNAHVVWPFRSVDVEFADQMHGEDLPVVAVDWVADIALIDVSTIDSLPVPVPLESTPYSPGDPVFLVGIPADESQAIEPSVTEGTISRTSRWHEADITFIESDVLISGGQSGGALVNGSGKVIGIASLELGEGLTLALDVSDVRTVIDSMLQRVDPHGIGDRWPDTLAADTAAIPTAHALDETVFVFDADPGEEISIIVDGAVISGSVIGPDGFLEATLIDGALEFTAELSGPHFAAIVPGPAVSEAVSVTANVAVRVLSDPDRAVEVAVGTVQFANIDYPGDVDWFTIALDAGDTITVSATSPNADMAILMGPATDPTGPEARSDSDSGAGVIGADAELRYTAASPGRYIIAIADETQFGPGAYALRIAER